MTVDRALNRPHYPNLAGRLSAKSAKIREIHPRTDTAMQTEMERVPAMVCVGQAPPKILPKKIVAPDSGLSAANRIKFIMSGGMGQKTGARVDGDPEKMARAVFEFLKEKNIIRSLREP
jgi:electron transfer flavoprotein alpha/beta subunit